MSQHIIAHLSAADPVMGALIAAVGPYAPEPHEEVHPFQVLTHAIAHQQLNGTAAATILRRLVEACGAGGFPSPEWVIAAEPARLRAAGFSFAKIAALKDLAAKTLEDVVPGHAVLAALGDEEIVARLTQVRGIGRWTVEMLLMFRLGREDVLPVDDFGVRAGFRAAYGLKSMPHPRALHAYGERWRPFRSAAAWYLWRALELKRAGTLPAPALKTRMPQVPRRRRIRAAPRKRARAPVAARRPAPKTLKRTARRPARNPVRNKPARRARK